MDVISAATFLFLSLTGRTADLIHMFLNRCLPPVAIAALLFILPPYLFLKLLLFAFRSAFSEDVASKVVLITGASSGIGEHLAYSYAKRGACLALVARRENRLRDVATLAYQLGSPDVVIIQGDVSRAEECERFINQTIDHFGCLDHLVTNAGIAPICMFEDCPDITKLAPATDINFWGSVYSSYFALPYLKRRRGKIVAIASAAGWLPAPRMSVYNASKAAVISFYETLRTELGSEITITIVTPGLIESEMTQGKFLSKEGRMVLDPQLRDVQVSAIPIRSVEVAAEEIVKGACRGDNYLTEPAWVKWTFYWKVFCPEVLEWCHRLLLVAGTEISERNALSFKLLEPTGLKQFLYPPSVQFSDLAETCRQTRSFPMSCTQNLGHDS